MQSKSVAQLAGIEFDTGISMKDRLDYLVKKLGDPHCFFVGDIKVCLSFTEGSANLQARMTDFLCRNI